MITQAERTIKPMARRFYEGGIEGELERKFALDLERKKQQHLEPETVVAVNSSSLPVQHLASRPSSVTVPILITVGIVILALSAII